MPLVKRIAGNLHRIGFVGLDLTKRGIIKVFDEFGIDCTDEKPRIGEPPRHRLMIAAGILHNDPCISVKGLNLPDKSIDLRGRMPDLVRTGNDLSKWAKDRHHAFAFRNIDTYSVHSPPPE